MLGIQKMGRVFEAFKRTLQSLELPPVDTVILITIRADGMYRIDIQMLDSDHLHVPASSVTGWIRDGDIESKIEAGK